MTGWEEAGVSASGQQNLVVLSECGLCNLMAWDQIPVLLLTIDEAWFSLL